MSYATTPCSSGIVYIETLVHHQSCIESKVMLIMVQMSRRLSSCKAALAHDTIANQNKCHARLLFAFEMKSRKSHSSLRLLKSFANTLFPVSSPTIPVFVKTWTYILWIWLKPAMLSVRLSSSLSMFCEKACRYRVDLCCSCRHL